MASKSGKDGGPVKVSKTPAPVEPGQSAGEAFVTVLRHNFEFLPRWEQAARSWEDIEGVHQMRVSFRRMRSALVCFSPAVPRALTREWAEEMRWLAGELGNARDLDVFVDEALGAISGKLDLPGEEALRALIQARRAVAYDRVRAMLDGERYAAFVSRFGAWLADESSIREGVSAKTRKRMDSNVVRFARRVLDKQERKVLSRGSHIDVEDHVEMHRLRIECKKLRYAAEFFGPLFPGTSGFIEHLRGLQDLLGVLNDVSVMPALLEDVFTEDADRRAAEYAGGVIGWRTREYFELRESFDVRWSEFVDAKHPWWKKSRAAA